MAQREDASNNPPITSLPKECFTETLPGFKLTQFSSTIVWSYRKSRLTGYLRLFARSKIGDQSLHHESQP
jgi:hypothetical protein